MAGLADLMKKGAGTTSPAAVPSIPPAPQAQDIFNRPEPTTAHPINGGDTVRVHFHGPGSITSIEVEAVVGGALQRIKFSEGTNPADVLPILRGFDAHAKVRDDFPKGGFGGGGKRETKTARVLVINADVRDSGKFISMTARDGDEDLNIAVGKKAVDEWLGKVEALGKLTEKSLAKLRATFDAKKPSTLILAEHEQFGAAYWKTEEGKAFLEEMKAEAPAAVAEGGDA